MAFFDNILLSLEALKSNKMRAILTMLGIIIGIGSVIAIDTVGASLTSSVTDSMQSLGASTITVKLTQKESDDESEKSSVRVRMFADENPTESDLITDDMIENFKSDFKDDVAYIELSRSVGTASSQNYDDNEETTSVSVLGVNDDYFVSQDVTILSGRALKNDKDGEKKLCVVSDEFVKDCLGKTPDEVIGETVTVTLNNEPLTFFITGVYEYEEETLSTAFSSETVTSFYIPLDTAKRLNGDLDGYESFSIISSANTDTSKFLNTVGEYFENIYSRNDSFTAEASSLESLVSTFTDMLDTISLAIAAIAAISLLVGGIGVMNIMLVSITERTREIGTRKALGATNSSIRWQFITEAMVICLIGGIIGIAFGVSLGVIISKMIGFSASPSIASIIGALLFSMGIGVLFGYAPANKAAKLNPIDALRYE